MSLSVTTARGGVLTGFGMTLAWCGSMCCNATGTNRTFNLGRVGAGTYTVIPIATNGCVVRFGGVNGTHASFNGQRLTNPADAGEWIYAPGSVSISLVEDPIVDIPHDCLNGGCIPTTTYNTPGVYASLATCQSGCAKNSNCTGECVSPAQIAALQAATTNLISRYCK